MSVCTTYVGVSQKKIRKKLRGREIRGRNYERKCLMNLCTIETYYKQFDYDIPK